MPKTFAKILVFIIISFTTILGTMISIFKPEVAPVVAVLVALSGAFAGGLAVGGLSDAGAVGAFAIIFAASVAGTVGGVAHAFAAGTVTVGAILIANAAIEFLHARKGA